MVAVPQIYLWQNRIGLNTHKWMHVKWGNMDKVCGFCERQFLDCNCRRYRYKPNVWVPSKFICWNLIPNVITFGGRAFGRWLGREGGAVITGVPESSLAPPAMWGHGKKTTIFEPGKEPSPHTQSASTLVLFFPASSPVKNKCLVFFKPPSRWCFCYSGLNRWSQLPMGKTGWRMYGLSQNYFSQLHVNLKTSSKSFLKPTIVDIFCMFMCTSHLVIISFG